MSRKKNLPKPLTVIIRIKNIVFGVIVAILFSVIVITLVVRMTDNTPSFFGFSLYRVSSPSMSPTLEVGDIILVGPCDPLTLNSGDIVTFNGNSENNFEGKTITHRVVVPPYREGTENYIVTRGDANAYNDRPLNTKDVIGKYIVKADIIKLLYDFFITPWGLLTLIALIIIAFFDEIIIFVKALIGTEVEEERPESVEELIERYKRENSEEPSASDAEEVSENTSANVGSLPDNAEGADKALADEEVDDYIF